MSAPKPRRTRLRQPQQQTDYEVGYGKPPVSTRFPKGRSGNPRGRPKGSRNSRPALNEERLKEIVLEEAYRTIRVNEAGKQVTIPMAQAIVRSLAVNAAKGNHRAQHLFTELLSATERDNKRLHDEWLQTAIQYKAEWEREIERCKRLNIKVPEPIPHPDHIIDRQTGDIRIAGPLTKEEKPFWNEMRERKAECDRTIAELKRILHDNPEYEYKSSVLADLEHERKIRAIIAEAIPE